MKKIIAVMLLVFLLCGCQKMEKDIEPATQLRQRLQSAQGCTFDAEITADYGDSVYTFTMLCRTDKEGNMTFTVSEPDSISGITGMVRAERGEIIFDDQVLAFNTLADGYITPVVSPWVMTHGLIGGYIRSCGKDGENQRITLNDSYADDALEMDVWLDADGNPIRCEILYRERRCLTIKVKNFTCL